MSCILPDGGHVSVLAPLVPKAFIALLEQHGIRFQVGQSLIDADANDAMRLLAGIHELELPLVLIFNRGRVMVLPQGVSKATGLQTALDMLRASARNALAVGDGENDHELLRPAEVGVAVEWGSASLQAAADLVSGSGPADVARFIIRAVEERRLPVPLRARRRVFRGHTEDGRELSLGVRGRNVLIAGDTKSGKSWLAGLFCEQLMLHGYCICVPVTKGRGFVLGRTGGSHLSGRARSRWIDDVFGDHALAEEIRFQEQRYVRGRTPGYACDDRRRYQIPVRLDRRRRCSAPVCRAGPLG